MIPTNRFAVGAIYFTRTESLFTVYPDGKTAESGGYWKCSACLLHLLREETPVSHAMTRHLWNLTVEAAPA